jgi:hypothetical protein
MGSEGADYASGSRSTGSDVAEDASPRHARGEGAGNGRNADLQHSMEARDVHKAFGSFKVLQGLDLKFQDDAITTISGPVGYR